MRRRDRERVVVIVANACAGIAAGVWLYGLWFVAPLFARRTDACPERVVASIAIGVGVPFALGLAGLATGPALWLALVALGAARVARYGWTDAIVRPERARAIALGAALAVFVALATPPLVRPLMDGDTLEYHLPLVASFAAHRGIWTTGTRYWWYPFGSELFALGIYATSGLRNVGLAGMVPAALLAARIVASRSPGSRLPTTALACGLLATSVAGRELVSLQNDVWLAALFVESVLAFDLAAAATTALVKPSGFAFAAIATVVGRVRPWRALVAAVPFALWLGRDARLWSTAPPGSTLGTHAWRTSLAFHVPEVVRGLPHAFAAAGAAWSLVVVTALVGYAVARDARARVAGALAALAYAFAPFGYDNGTPQFADGHSFRFALPAVALGVALFAASPRVDARVKSALGIATCAFGIAETWLVFASDAKTFVTPALVVLALVVFFGRKLVRPADTIFACAALAYAAFVAVTGGANPADYVDDRYGVGGRPTHAFAWLARHPARRIVVDGVPAGAVSTVLPEADVGNVREDASPCDDARARAAWLVIATARERATRCGRRLYADEALAIDAP